jgi:transposase-like protein
MHWPVSVYLCSSVVNALAFYPTVPRFNSHMAHWNIYKLTKEVLRNRDRTIEWLQDKGLLRRERECRRCRKPMQLEFTGHGFGRFRCRRGHDVEVSLAKDTWFEDARISPEKAVLLTYCFAVDMDSKQAIRETSMDGETTSSETVVDWYSFCRQMCMHSLDQQFETLIGGPGHIVEIDECKIGRTKYSRGRFVEGHWILGMMDHDGGYRLEICPENKRDRQTLQALITKHVAPDTTIMTDCWKGYEGLDEIGFEHFTVNHSYNFVDPDTGANTQRIESSWRALRKKLSRGGVKGEHLAFHLCEYLWRRQLQDSDPFETLIQDIKRMFPQA